ncbi:MAG: hypothetical protein JST09_08200 [Bacteroidetes bacterium]|nr:hypothetical protein [Bacteroidota bacterium]MBS1607257.1 hypothetical protein [Bacteroidota bacterium]
MATFVLKRDNLKLGLLLGFLGPLVGIFIVYLITARSTPFSVFMQEFFNNNKMITSIGSLSLLANIILFTVYINTHRDSTAKGIFITTCLYGVAILLLKIFN